jgi:nucleoside-diphosphate-sugar epimerase
MFDKSKLNEYSFDLITVFGPDGFIGSNLTRRFRSMGLAVQSISRGQQYKTGSNLGHVVYCAGLTSDFRHKVLDTIDAHACNVHKIFKTAAFQSFTYLSSTKVYAGASSTLEGEKVTLCPERLSDLYSLSKLMGEAICYTSGHPNVKVARLSNIVGLRSDTDIFIDQLLDEVVRCKTLTLQASISAEKDYLHIDEAIDAIVFLVLSDVSGCFNVASGENVSNRRIVEHLKAAFDFVFTESAEDVSEQSIPINIEKLSSLMEFSPRRFDEFFPIYLNDYKNIRGIE